MVHGHIDLLQNKGLIAKHDHCNSNSEQSTLISIHNFKVKCRDGEPYVGSVPGGRNGSELLSVCRALSGGEFLVGQVKKIRKTNLRKKFNA